MQNRVNQWADARGILRTTLTLRGRRGWPDEVYWLPKGKPLLIEFKAAGEVPRKLQLFIHHLLKSLGYDIQTHDNAEDAIKAIDAKLPKGWVPDRVDPRTLSAGRSAVSARARGRRRVSRPRSSQD